MGDTDHRAKFNMIVADGIEPFLYCEEYMDREANENELKQVSRATARTRMTVAHRKTLEYPQNTALSWLSVSER